ncbi:MAG: hypothetical protein ISP71_06395 [Flavobacteriales bacterium]|nr:hypothetical protein [Flavobacteriales bacterium]
MKKYLSNIGTLCLLCVCLFVDAQDREQLLNLHSVNSTEMNNVSAPQSGQLIFNTIDSLVYLYDGISWKAIELGWCIDGNSAIDAEENFFGSTNNQDVKFETNNTQRMVVKNNGNIGVNTTNPLGYFHVKQTKDFIVTKKGFVGIGTSNPTEKVHVIGNVLASGSIESGIPDYVFEHYYEGYSPLNPNYTFLSLEEVKAFAKEHKHLPNVPTAQEVRKKGGIVVNQWTNQNLEKIEELFIHLIEMDKKVKKMTEQVEHLEN